MEPIGRSSEKMKPRKRGALGDTISRSDHPDDGAGTGSLTNTNTNVNANSGYPVVVNITPYCLQPSPHILRKLKHVELTAQPL
jgi:hypothetical protein